MTPLHDRKTRCIIETSATVFEQGRTRAVCVEFSPAAPHSVKLRLKGRRIAFAVKRAQSLAAAEKRAARKAAKHGN